MIEGRGDWVFFLICLLYLFIFVGLALRAWGRGGVPNTANAGPSPDKSGGGTAEWCVICFVRKFPAGAHV